MLKDTKADRTNTTHAVERLESGASGSGRRVEGEWREMGVGSKYVVCTIFTLPLFHPAHHILCAVRRPVQRSLRLIYLPFGLSSVSPQSIIVSSVYLHSLS